MSVLIFLGLLIAVAVCGVRLVAAIVVGMLCVGIGALAVLVGYLVG